MTLAADLYWAFCMMRARRFRHRLSYSRRRAFDLSLCPPVSEGSRLSIDYPDAFYHASVSDVARAMRSANERRIIREGPT